MSSRQNSIVVTGAREHNLKNVTVTLPRAALASLRYVHEWVGRQPLARLFTSEYLAIVEGFRTARIARAAAGWRVWDHGALRTVRFDATRAPVDLARSHGVLGFVHHQGALYVHLAGPEPALRWP